MAMVQGHPTVSEETASPKFKVFTRKDIDDIRELRALSEDERLQMKAVSAVLPFRVNNYVVEELIDWNNIPNDPIFQLTFPQPGMLEDGDFTRMLDLVKKDDAVILSQVDRFISDLVLVQQFIGFLFSENLPGLGDGNLTVLGLFGNQPFEDVGHLRIHLIHPHIGEHHGRDRFRQSLADLRQLLR